MCAADLFISKIVIHVCAPDSVRSFEEYQKRAGPEEGDDSGAKRFFFVAG